MTTPVDDDPFTGAPAPTDGRVLRREQSRQKMIDAGMRMIAKRQWRLTVVGVATGAGMAQRSFFYHFDSLDDYLEALIAQHGASIRADLVKHAGEFNDTLVRIVLKGKAT